MVRPSWKSFAYSYVWPEMKNAPRPKVREYHSRRPHRLKFSTEPVRPTWPRSAAKTPIWQVNELETSTAVFAMANGMFSSSVEVVHSDGTFASAAWAAVTLRIVKYAANSAAKNISSDASQMIVPTATGSGLPAR